MTEKTYDGATTALRRRAKRWKALAKRVRARHRDGAMVLHLQLKDARQRIEELTAELRKADEAALELASAHATERTAREQDTEAKDYWFEKACELERERDTALLQLAETEKERQRLSDSATQLLARAKELEADKAIIIEARDQAGIGWATAETALASARDFIESLVGSSAGSAALDAELNAWLTSPPAPVAAPCAGCEAVQAELERRTAWSNRQIAALQVDLAFAKSQRDDNENAWQCEKVKRENAEFRLKMAEDNVLSKHNAMLMAVKNADEFRRNWEACHRQHEQCMKLLEKCSLRLSPGNLRDLVREMLSNGELPEGTEL